MKSKRTEVTIETDEVWVIRHSGSVMAAWCPQCCQEVLMITPDEAAILTHLSARAIYRQVEAGLVHYTEMPEGFLLVCTDSITRLATKTGDQDMLIRLRSLKE